MLCLRVLWYEAGLESLAYNPPPRPYRLPEKRVQHHDKDNTVTVNIFLLCLLYGASFTKTMGKVLKSVTGGYNII